MMAEARQLLKALQKRHLEGLDVASRITDQELSQPTGDPNNPTLRHGLDRLHWHFAPRPRRTIPTHKNLGPRCHGRRSLSLPGLPGGLGPLTAESVTITPDVFAREPAPRKMSVKENLEHPVKAEGDCIVPGRTQAPECTWREGGGEPPCISPPGS